MATKTRKTSAMKTTRSVKKRGTARKRTVQVTVRGASTKRRSTSRPAKQTTVARVKRVTRDVVQQAGVAVVAGVETLKGLGENLVDRVRG